MLFIMINPADQHLATGYDTWTLEKLIQYNLKALETATPPLWYPIATAADPGESRRFVESRLAAMRS